MYGQFVIHMWECQNCKHTHRGMISIYIFMVGIEQSHELGYLQSKCPDITDQTFKCQGLEGDSVVIKAAER